MVYKTQSADSSGDAQVLAVPGLPHTLTAKVGAIAQLGLLVAAGEHTDTSVLDEVHLPAHGAFADDEVAWLEDLEAQFGQHRRHEVGVSVGEQGHVGHQASAVEAHDLLRKGCGGG